MPTVPTTFVPQVDPSTQPMPEARAQEVAAIEDYSGKQQMEQGRAMSNAGLSALRLGQRLQDDIDEAETKAAENFALKATQEALIGEKGYLHTAGANAQSQWQPAMQTVASAFKSAEDRLQTDTQKALFRQVKERSLLTIGHQMAEHKFRQVRAYSLAEAKTRAQNMVGLATLSYGDSPQISEAYRRAAQAEAATIAGIEGFPPDSDQARALTRGIDSAYVGGISETLARDGRYGEAAGLVERWAPGMDPAVVQDIRRSLDAGLDRTEAEGAVERILAGGTADRSPPTPEELGIAVATVFPGVKITSIVRSQDEQDALMAAGATKTPRSYHTPGAHQDGFQAFDMQPIPGMTIAEGVELMRRAGHQVTDIVDESKTGGTGPHWHMAIKLAGQGRDGSMQRFGPPPTEDEALERASTVRPEIRRDVEALVSRQFSLRAEAARSQAAARLQVAERTWHAAGGDWTRIPDKVFAGLPVADQQRLKGGLRAQSDPVAVAYLTENPGFSRADLDERAARLSPVDLVKFGQQLTAPYGGGVSINSDVFNAAAQKAGLDHLLVNNANKGLRIKMRGAITDEMIRQQGVLSRALSPAEQVKLIDNVLGETVMVESFFGDWELRVVTATGDELKEAYALVDGEKVDLDFITPAEHAAAIQALLLDDPLQRPTQQEILMTALRQREQDNGTR